MIEFHIPVKMQVYIGSDEIYFFRIHTELWALRIVHLLI
jgi:hypothetical protein